MDVGEAWGGSEVGGGPVLKGGNGGGANIDPFGLLLCVLLELPPPLKEYPGLWGGG